MFESGHTADELVRLFIAVEMDEVVRRNLEAEQARLKQCIGGVKWVPLETTHLTLVFLGDVFAGQVDGITRVMDEEAGACTPFVLEVTGLGVFGSGRCPRVIWAGVGKGGEVLESVQARMTAGLKQLNLSIESRPFHPHFTLGRVKFPREALGLVEALAIPASTVYGEFTVDRVVLIRSELHAWGAAYHTRHVSQFPSEKNRQYQAGMTK